MRRVLVLAFFGLGLSFSLGCSSTDTTCEELGSCGSGATGGTGADSGTGATGGAGGGSGGDGGGCDTSKSPSEEACLISDDHGIFVSPTGSDTTGNGTQASPYQTLSKAVSEASSASKNVYACDDGTGYTESATLTLGASFDGLGLFGGFDCGDWSYSTSKKSKLSGAATAVRIENVPGSARVEDFDITAANGASPGESSIAAAVSSSEGVAIRRVNLTAGMGANGQKGQNGTPGANGASTNPHVGTAFKCTSAPPTQVGGDWGADSACGSRGGKGGVAQEEGPGGPGSFGIPQKNVIPEDLANGGGGASTVGVAFPGGNGQPGSVGKPGTAGPAAAASGSFSSTGFTPADGGAGTDGFPGQGGGGGGASAASVATTNCIGASGGAGGMGGCGGTKGAGGGGGGASVALLLWQSTATVDSCELTAAKGGDGANGGDAGPGGGGGPGATGGAGNGVTIAKGGDGATGGGGGPGGAGAGGSGGPSYALVWKTTPPTKVGTVTLIPGVGGAKGDGGVGATNGPDGSDGADGEEFEQP